METADALAIEAALRESKCQGPIFIFNVHLLN